MDRRILTVPAIVAVSCAVGVQAGALIFQKVLKLKLADNIDEICSKYTPEEQKLLIDFMNQITRRLTVQKLTRSSKWVKKPSLI
jgi:hypothetical protein